MEIAAWNPKPILNIEEKYGYHYYRMIIIIKTIFVLYAIEKNIPKAWSFYSMAVCKFNIVCKDPKMTLVAFIGLVLNYFGFYFAQMTIMGMVAMSYKSYEYLLDIFVLLCFLYYAFQTYEIETVELFTVINLTFAICAYINCLESTELFQKGVYYVTAIFYLLSFLPLLPNRQIYRQRLMYVYLIQTTWIFYNAGLQSSEAKLLAVEIRNRTDVCPIMQHRFEIDKCGLNETLENMEFFNQNINMSNRKIYTTQQKVNLPVESKKEIANEKIAYVTKLREHKLDNDVIFRMNVDNTERKISGVERQSECETSESIENAKTAQRYDSITEPGENQISTSGGEKSTFIEDNINIEEKPFVDLHHREENQLQSPIYLEGSIKTETRASVKLVSDSNVPNGSKISEPRKTGGKEEQIENKATNARNIEVGSLDETGVTGNKPEVIKSAMKEFQVGETNNARSMVATETQVKAADVTEHRKPQTQLSEFTKPKDSLTIRTDSNPITDQAIYRKPGEYDSFKATDPTTKNVDETSDSSVGETEQFEDSESKNIQVQTLEYSDKEALKNEKETNIDSRSRRDLLNTLAKVHSQSIFSDESNKYKANTFLSTDAIESKTIMHDDREAELQDTIPYQMAHDPETTDLPTSKANKARTTEIPKTQTDETESSETYKFPKEIQESGFPNATSGDLRTEDIKSTTVEAFKTNPTSTEEDKEENSHDSASKAKKYQASGTDKLETNKSEIFQINQVKAVLSEPHSGKSPKREFGNSTSEFRKTLAANTTERKAPKGSLGTSKRKSNQKEKESNFVANEHETDKISHPKMKEFETTEDIFSNEKEIKFFETAGSEESLSSTKYVPIKNIKPTINNEKNRPETRETTELKNNKIELSLNNKDNSVVKKVLPTGPQIHAFNIRRKTRVGRETENKMKIENFGASKYQPIKSGGIKLKPKVRGVNDVKNIEFKATEAHNVKLPEQATETNVASKTQLKEKELKKDESILPVIPRKLKHKLIGPPRPSDNKVSKVSNVGEHEIEIAHIRENKGYRLAAY